MGFLKSQRPGWLKGQQLHFSKKMPSSTMTWSNKDWLPSPFRILTGCSLDLNQLTLRLGAMNLLTHVDDHSLRLRTKLRTSTNYCKHIMRLSIHGSDCWEKVQQFPFNYFSLIYLRRFQVSGVFTEPTWENLGYDSNRWISHLAESCMLK